MFGDGCVHLGDDAFGGWLPWWSRSSDGHLDGDASGGRFPSEVAALDVGEGYGPW
jgi:hypothetical protein